jgi:hypothetical protein
MPNYLENTVPKSALEAKDWAKEHTSPRGKLAPWIPDLLDQRRVELSIPDPVFTVEAVYDRLLLWQISASEDEHFIKGGQIIKPNEAAEREKQQAPIGIVVSAGLGALDHLKCNGMDLGHTVMFVRLSPWRPPIDMPNGQQVRVVCCRSGDICGSLEIPRLREAGTLRTDVVAFDDGDIQHVLREEGKPLLRPMVPGNIGEEY